MSSKGTILVVDDELGPRESLRMILKPIYDVHAAAADGDSPVYVQVSVSQNREWSTENAQQLARAGLPAQVLPPRSAEDGYRVVLGPYPTRTEAEAIGRKLGRPFWIFQAGEVP